MLNISCSGILTHPKFDCNKLFPFGNLRWLPADAEYGMNQGFLLHAPLQCPNKLIAFGLDIILHIEDLLALATLLALQPLEFLL